MDLPGILQGLHENPTPFRHSRRFQWVSRVFQVASRSFLRSQEVSREFQAAFYVFHGYSRSFRRFQGRSRRSQGRSKFQGVSGMGFRGCYGHFSEFLCTSRECQVFQGISRPL